MRAGKNRKMFHEKYLLQSLNTGFKILSPKNKGSYTEEKEKERKERKDGREGRREGGKKRRTFTLFLQNTTGVLW